MKETIAKLNALPDSEYQAVIYILYANMAEDDAARALRVSRSQFRQIFNSALGKLNSQHRA